MTLEHILVKNAERYWLRICLDLYRLDLGTRGSTLVRRRISREGMVEATLGFMFYRRSIQ
jgi:hypothetical protein